MSKITINQLHMALCEANSIMLTVHVRPDGDAIGSMVAFYEALVAQGKTVYMVVDDVIPEKYSFLSYIDQIKDVAYFETHPVQVDMLMVLDASTYERIGRVGALFSAPIFNIDHHISNSEFADHLYLKPDLRLLVKLLRTCANNGIGLLQSLWAMLFIWRLPPTVDSLNLVILQLIHLKWLAVVSLLGLALMLFPKRLRPSVQHVLN